MSYYIPLTASKESIYKLMGYEEYSFYVDWKAFTRIHGFNMDSYYSFKGKLASGTLVDYAYEKGIKVAQVNLYNFFPSQGLIADSCLIHFPVFHWASEHAGYNVLRIQHLKTEEILCDGSDNEYECIDANSYSYFSFSFFIHNTGLMTSPNGTFNFKLNYEPTSEYEFKTMKLSHIIKTPHVSTLDEITSDLGAQLDNQIGNSTVTYENYALNPRKRYEVTVYVERSRPENSVSQVSLKFGASYILDPALLDEELGLVVDEIYGRLLVEPDVKVHTELIIVNEYTDTETNPGDYSTQDIDELIESNSEEDEDEDSDSNKKEIILGVVIAVIIVVGIIITAFFIYVCKKKKQNKQDLGNNNPNYLAAQEDPKFVPIHQPESTKNGSLEINKDIQPVNSQKTIIDIELRESSRI